MKNENQKKIYALQSNLSSIRKLAGWTAEEFGEKIGVTKQTISNLENNKTPMNLTQYIAIRSVIDCEIETNKNNEILSQAVTLLLDNQDLDDEQYKKISDAVKATAASAAAGISGAALASIFTGLVSSSVGTATFIGGSALLGPAGLLAGGAAAGAALWLKKLLKKK